MAFPPLSPPYRSATPSSSNSKVPHSPLAESASITPQIAEHGGEEFRLVQDQNKADALWGDRSMKNVRRHTTR
ncbi:hypothetical protein CPC08DRAFT_716541 [Agrocybe pediades]|nr:hypothetical protein CPC08DRAFT_716541 [Agrocybe pediades]